MNLRSLSGGADSFAVAEAVGVGLGGSLIMAPLFTAATAGASMIGLEDFRVRPMDVPIPVNVPRFYLPEGPLADAIREEIEQRAPATSKPTAIAPTAGAAS